MRSAHYARIAVCNLALKGSVVAIVVSLCVLMISQADVGDSDPPPNAARVIEPSLVGDTAQVALNVPPGRLSSRYSMRDEEGKELVLMTYDRTGNIAVMLGEHFPARASCFATPAGLYKLNVAHGGLEYKLDIKPDGASDYSVSGPSLGVRDGLRLMPVGKPAHEPSNAY